MKNCYIPVKGGLGNQMFYYSYILYLKHHKIDSKFLWYEFLITKHHHGLELSNVFDLSESNGSTDFKSAAKYLTISKLISIKYVKKIIYKAIKLYYKNKYNYYFSKPYDFYDYNFILSNRNDNLILDGFWQNYNYCNEIRNVILEKVDFKDTSVLSSRLINNILISNSVSLHIRRGDYLHSQFSDLNICTIDNYFNKAIDLIRNKVPDCQFYIFSDDLEWCKKKFDNESFHFIEGVDDKYSYLNIYLMSLCKHNIISNSTFSWWGAWLNNNFNKIVIAPSQWTRSTSSKFICPESWNFINI